jgi:Na+/citrate or Na+/malate symporter
VSGNDNFIKKLNKLFITMKTKLIFILLFSLTFLYVDAKEKANNVALNVINIIGEVVLANSISLNVGDNSIPLKLGHLEAGIYTVELTSTSVNISHKLVKLD